ncbi:MAG: hypothetical protein ACXVFK_14095 [Solirubrobacteraceae bacterium]
MIRLAREIDVAGVAELLPSDAEPAERVRTPPAPRPAPAPHLTLIRCGERA